MGKFDGVLLASDFDNTLIYTEPALRSGTPVPSLSAKNRDALEYFMAEGGRFAISTGRALAAFAPMAGEIPMNTPGVICNGAAIYDFKTQDYLEYAMLDTHARERAQAVLEAFPPVAVEAYHIDNVIHAVRPNDITRKHQHITHVSGEERVSVTDVPLPLGKLLFEADHDTLQHILKFVQEKGWETEYEWIFSGKTLLEMTAKGASKGGMVMKLASLLGISNRHIYCAGDESNDLSMLAVAEEGFAPDNCITAVRESGATIVAHADCDAMAEIIQILDQRY